MVEGALLVLMQTSANMLRDLTSTTLDTEVPSKEVRVKSPCHTCIFSRKVELVPLVWSWENIYI